MRQPHSFTSSALALMASTGVTSALGVVFWALAAHFYSPAALGEDSGLIAAMTLLASVSGLSMGQGIPRLLPQVVKNRRLAVLGVYVVTCCLGIALTTGFVTLAPMASSGFAFLGQDHSLQALLVAAVALWIVFNLQDPVLVAVRMAIVVPFENAAFGALKIMLILIFASSGHGVLTAWLVAMVVVVPIVNALLFGWLLGHRSETKGESSLPLGDRSRVLRFLAGDYMGFLLSQGCTLLLPVLVVAMLGHEANAYFYVAFTIATAVNMLAVALATALVAEGAHNGGAQQLLAVQVLRRYLVLLVPGILVLVLTAPLVLQPFGPLYVEKASPLLRLLLVGALFQTFVTVYLGIERVRGRASRILRTEAIAFAVILGGFVMLLPSMRLEGAGIAWALGWSVVAVVVLPTVLELAGLHMTRLPIGAYVRKDPLRAASLFLTFATVGMAVANLGGAVRILAAALFVTFVPGWAIVGRVKWIDGFGRVALAVGISLSVETLLTATMAWAHAWNPMALLYGLGVGSVTLLHWNLLSRTSKEHRPVEPIWVGQVELSEMVQGLTIQGYNIARLLVRLHGQPLGYVTVSLSDGYLEPRGLHETIWLKLGDEIRAHLANDGIVPAPGEVLRAGPCRGAKPSWYRSISIVVITRDRPQALLHCVEALLRVHYPGLEVIVVDNAPATEATAELFRNGGCLANDRRVRYVREHRPGVAWARNRGAQEARGEVVAFADDDVVVDPDWLVALNAGFDKSAEVACVTGLVPAARLDTEAEQIFDRRVSWGRNFDARLFDMREHRPNSYLYPYLVGEFGVTANCAVKRNFLLEIGGFDPAFRTGEDIDLFVRILRAGGAIFRQPMAIAWHMHRADSENLRKQMYGYGRGLTALATKFLLNPRTGLGILSRIPGGLRHLGTLERRSGQKQAKPVGVILAELRGMIAGPVSYLSGRYTVRRLS